MILDNATKLAVRLLDNFCPVFAQREYGGVGEIAGSIRRGAPEPGDIELLLPMPPDGTPASGDLIMRALEPFLILDSKWQDKCKGLDITATSDKRHFSVVKGFKPGFRLCQLHCEPRKVWAGIRGWGQLDPFDVDIFRYEPPGRVAESYGHPTEGNFGQIYMIRTGSAGFSKAFVTEWKILQGFAPGADGKEPDTSINGYPIDSGGVLHGTRTEQDAFNLVGLEWIPPHERISDRSLIRKQRSRQGVAA